MLKGAKFLSQYCLMFLVFFHHCTLQITFLHVGPLCAAILSMHVMENWAEHDIKHAFVCSPYWWTRFRAFLVLGKLSSQL